MVDLNTSQSQSEDEGGGSQATPQATVMSTSAEWTLECIDMENFKSYAGHVRIGPLRSFVAVIGPNGSGKSNLMDAISFVMGERSASLRVRRLNELIHGASVGKPVASTASVTAVFRQKPQPTSNDQRERRFSRVIRGASCDYLIDGSTVTQQIYYEQLKKIGINAKGKNFLVFQGAIESIAMKSSKERTALLEEICGSGALKEEYDKAKSELVDMQQKVELAFMKKKTLIGERKDVKLEMQEAKVYQGLMNQLNEKEVEIHLFKLNYNEIETGRLEEVLISRDGDIRRGEKLKKNAEERLAAIRKERGVLNRSLAEKEMELQTLEQQVNAKESKVKLIEVQQRLKHLQNKLSLAERSLKQAEDNKMCVDQNVEDLQKNLDEAQAEEKEWLRIHDEEQMEEGAEVTFRESQINEYYELKQQTESFVENERKHKLEAKKKDQDEVFNTLNDKKKDLEGQIELKEHQLWEKEKLRGKTRQAIENLDEQLKEKVQEVRDKREAVTNAENRIEELQKNLEKITSELGAMKMDRHEFSRKKRKTEVLEALKSHFKGVFNRVTNLAKPCHQRYHVAITKIMGNHLEAIVVDGERTARDCIQYLKEQMMEPEVFLPLDLLDVQPLKTRYRAKKNDEIHLAYDLLNFDKSVEKAILQCTKNTVICMTDDKACQVAAGEIFGEPTNAVTLEGTLYAKSGIISGGKAHLERKARRWNDNDMSAKEEEKIKIRDELKELVKSTRDKMLVDLMDVEVQGLKNRLKYAQPECAKQDAEVEQLKRDIENLNDELKKLLPRWKEMQTAVVKMDKEIKEVQQEICVKEDALFASFCEKVGIPNIRVYERQAMNAHKEFKDRCGVLQNKIYEIQAKLDYDLGIQKSNGDNVKRWEKAVADIKGSLKECKKEEKRILSELKVYEAELSKIQAEVEEAKQKVDEKSKELKEKTRESIELDKTLIKTQKALTVIQNEIAQKKSERHELLKHCKLAGINIKFTNGSLDEIYMDDLGLTNATTSTEVDIAMEKESRLAVDYEALPLSLRNLQSKDAIKQALSDLEAQLKELERQITNISAPNMKACDKWESINAKVREQQAELNEIHQQNRAARAAFEKVKNERHKKFMECYNKISSELDGIYKGLTQSNSAQAVLGLDNPEEPYLDGISYNCVAPGKRFQPMQNLSGGEKTLAALALLFAIHGYEPCPLFVLDEIDAALDNTNIGKVTSFIKGRTSDVQIVLISLKEEFFQHADALIGIAPGVQEAEEIIQSKVYTLDLTEYLER